jgi:sugar phosphate permease
MTEEKKNSQSQVSVNSFADGYHDQHDPQERDLEHERAIEKKLVRMLDYRLLIWAFFGYFANGLDRNNMPNAYTSGLPEDLNLVDEQYNWAVTLFFIGYVM